MGEFSATVKKWILASEGGYVDHPRDPGGATSLGITRKTLSAWRGEPVSKQAVRDLTQREALHIYKEQYWDTVRADLLPDGLDYAVFDYAVNSGPARAARDLQRVLGVAVDGIIGPVTLRAIKAARDAHGLIKLLCDRRWKFMQSLSTFSTFGVGWRRRVWGSQMGIQAGGDTGVADRATKLAQGAAADVPMPSPAPGKAEPEAPSAIAAIVKDPGGLSGMGAAVAAVTGAIADQPILQIGAVVLIAALVWRFVIVRTREEPA